MVKCGWDMKEIKMLHSSLVHSISIVFTGQKFHLQLVIVQMFISQL